MQPRLTFTLLFLLCATALVAQSAPSANSGQNPSMRPGMRAGMQPCFRQAGIDRSAIEQLHSLQRDMHSQIQTVCSNTSLTPQEKQKQAQEIHAQFRQKIEGVITPDQQKALEACRQQHGESTPGIFSGHGGGCGRGQRGGAQPGNIKPGATPEQNQPSPQD